MRDDELGTRLEEAFRAHAGEMHRASGLAWEARRRLRRRRAAVSTSAVVVGVIALGSVWGSAGGLGGADDSADTAGAGKAEAPADQGSLRSPEPAAGGWRWESFGGVEVSVPAAWAYGVTDAPWCADNNRGQRDGEVGRPGPVRHILCAEKIPVHLLGAHVWLSGVEAGRPAPKPATVELGGGWVRDVLVVGKVRIEVQTRSNPQVRDRILGSVRQVRTDLNGCPVEHPVTTGGWQRPARGPAWTAAVTGVSICRYETEPYGGHLLIASARQDAAGAGSLLARIRSAPAGAGPNDPRGAADYLGSEVTVLRFGTTDGVREVYVRYSGSRHNGFDNGTEVRLLTRAAAAFMTGPLVVLAGPGVTLDLLPRR